MVDSPVSWPEEKRCSRCKRLKRAADFYRSKRSRDGLGSWCKECESARGKAYEARPDIKAARARRVKARAGTPERREQQRRANLKMYYGLTIEDYDRMLAEQGGGCAICGRKPSSRRLNVDHDHSCCPGVKSCGKCVRGLLCQQCNHKVLGFWLHEGTKGTAQALEVARRLVTYLENGGVHGG